MSISGMRPRAADHSFPRRISGVLIGAAASASAARRRREAPSGGPEEGDPAELKKTVAKYVNEFLAPVREHFEKDEKARKLKEQVESFKVTR